LSKFEAELDLVEASDREDAYHSSTYGGVITGMRQDQDRVGYNEALKDLIKDIDKCDNLYLTY